MKKLVLLFTALLLTSIAVHAQSVVINKVFNASTATTGLNDAVELLVVHHKFDLRGLYLKDYTGSTLTGTTYADGGGKYQFTNNDLWAHLPQGTTVILRKVPTTDDSYASYVQDTDPSDFIIDVSLENPLYFTVIAAGFNPQNYDMVVLKGGASATGTTDLIHAFAFGTANKTTYTGITGPKLGTAEILTNCFVYPTSPTTSLADYNGIAVGKTLTTDTEKPAWGKGEPGNNAAFITYLRNLVVIDTTYSESAPTAATVVFTARFSKPVTGVDLTDFNLTTTGTVTGTLASIAGSGTTYTVTVTGVTGEGTITLNKIASGTGITNGVNPILEGFAYTAGAAHIVGKVPPVVVDNQSFAARIGAANGDYIGTVTGTLQGEGAIDGWAIVSGNTDNVFAIDAQGKLTVANNAGFDYDKIQDYTLEVTASNGAGRVSLPVKIAVKLLTAPNTPKVVGAINGIVATLTPLLTGDLIASNNAISNYAPFRVTIYADGVEIATNITVNTSGVWTYKLPAPLTSGKHVFYIKANYNGTLSDASPSVEVSIIPSGWALTPYNILTPNGDGKNDTWKVTNIEYYAQNEVTVFNKIGEVVFYSKNYQQDWDGTNNGVPLNSGTYYYQIKLGPAEKPLKGYITLIRNK